MENNCLRFNWTENCVIDTFYNRTSIVLPLRLSVVLHPTKKNTRFLLLAPNGLFMLWWCPSYSFIDVTNCVINIFLSSENIQELFSSNSRLHLKLYILMLSCQSPVPFVFVLVPVYGLSTMADHETKWIGRKFLKSPDGHPSWAPFDQLSNVSRDNFTFSSLEIVRWDDILI